MGWGRRDSLVELWRVGGGCDTGTSVATIVNFTMRRLSKVTSDDSEAMLGVQECKPGGATYSLSKDLPNAHGLMTFPIFWHSGRLFPDIPNDIVTPKYTILLASNAQPM